MYGFLRPRPLQLDNLNSGSRSVYHVINLLNNLRTAISIIGDVLVVLKQNAVQSIVDK